jgi:uncharacterized protein (TIGR03435 family)
VRTISKFLTGAAAIAAIALMTLAAGARGQSPTSFEVASIRPAPDNQNGPTGVNVFDGGRLRITNAATRFLILDTFRIQKEQIVGGPGWLDTDRFDIEAKTGRPEKITQDQVPPLLENLLAERFHFRFHRETRDLTVNLLDIDKNGPKLKPSADGTATDMRMNQGPGKSQLTGTGVSMQSLAAYLGLFLGRIVVDQSGLKGNYDLTLEWSPDQTNDTAAPSLFTALQEQLGLRLHSGRAPVEMIVIDSVEKPSEN